MSGWKSIQTANRACALLYSYVKKRNKGVWLLPVNICPDIPLTLHLAHASYEFVDIDKNNFCIDEEKCKNLISNTPNKYTGIVYVRTYGFLSNISSFIAECKRLNPTFCFIDDRCLCMPETNPHTYEADMILYSTGRCKPIDLGGGGLAFYSNVENYEIDKDLLFCNTDEESIYKDAFYNNRKLSPIPVGWLELSSFDIKHYDLLQLINKKRADVYKHKEKINNIYRSELPSFIQLPEPYQSWRFNIMVPSETQDLIIKELFSNNLFASCHYKSVNRLFDNNTYTNSDTLSANVINLFNDNNYTEAMAERTCQVILDILSKFNLSEFEMRVKPIYACMGGGKNNQFEM